MEELKSAINWFEIPATNFERAVGFYGAIYDFDMPTRKMGDTMMGFFQHQPGSGTGGAIICGDGSKPSADGSKLYLNAGDDLLTVLNRVETAGGTIIQSKTQISPEIGFFAVIADTEGNHIYLHSIN